MIGRILLGLGLAGAAAVVLAQGGGEINPNRFASGNANIYQRPGVVQREGRDVEATDYQVWHTVNGSGFLSLKIEKSPPGDEYLAVWRSDRYGKAVSCEEEAKVVAALAAHLKFAVYSSDLSKCRSIPSGILLRTIEEQGRMVLAPHGVARPTAPITATCKSDAYLGAWQRKGEGAQKTQVQIVFATERGASAPVGSTRGFASAPYGDGAVVASRIRQVGDSCTFDAQCGPNLSSANACKLVIDPAKNTLKVEGGSQMFISDRVWTRSAPMAVEATCSREDVEGDWRRSDGANVPIVGVHAFKNGPGGNALLFNHPEGWWPKGQTKFTGIYREGGDRSCKLKATCATYDRTASGTVVRRERACTLTIDPVKKRMTESGSSLFYTRDGAAKGTPAKPEAAAAVPTAQSAEEQAATSALNAQQAETAKREIAEYEAQTKRIADEQAAKEAAYRKALADREALIAENERKAREAYTKWEAAAAACRAGDQSQCAPQPKP